jgi:hypothetical protein
LPPDSAKINAAAVEIRTLGRPVLPASAKTLVSDVRNCLMIAADEGVLRSPPETIFRLLKTEERPLARGVMVVALLGGATFDKPQSDDDNFFIRSDGARLSFGITVAYRSGAEPEMLTYRFHLRFPRNSSPTFIRFDLNDESREPLVEPRSHLHPGSDNVRIPAPAMSPIEILEKLLYGTLAP